jgi:hypothetical protein
MTFWNGPIKFNVDEGSDTAASGLGPASPLTGNGASVTSGSGVVTGISTTGVSAGDLIWVDTSTGRKFGLIDSVDSATQVTCGQNYDVTEVGRNWAIGGKRATLDNARELFDNTYFYAPEHMTVSLETDQDLTGTTPLTGAGGVTRGVEIKSSIGGVKRILSYESANLIQGGTFYFRDLIIRSKWIYNGNTGGAVHHASTNGNIQNAYTYYYDCIVGEPTYPISTLISTQSRTVFVHAQNTVLQDFQTLSNQVSMELESCVIRNCSNYVFYQSGTAPAGSDVRRCIIYNNPGVLGSFRWGANLRFYDNVVYNCGQNGTAFVSQTGDRWDIRYQNFMNNIFVSNPGLLVTTPNILKRWRGHGNYYYNNSFQIPNDPAAKILSSDPFVDAANGDFNLNTSTAGGRDLRALNYDFGS